jgi:3-isopropylmalate dehydrogenase
MAYNIVVLPGDGIGPEVTDQALRVLDMVQKLTGREFEIAALPCGARHFLDHGEDWPAGSLARCRAADAILLGAIGLPSPEGRGSVRRPDGKMAGWEAIVGLRQNLDLYANIRPVKLHPGVRHRISGELSQVWRPENVDMVFYRENTEGLYCGMGGIRTPGGVAESATDIRLITRTASERIIRRAFEAAAGRAGAPEDGQSRVTCLVKDNVLYGCRLFLEVYEEVGADFPEVAREVVLIDAFTQLLLRRPEHFDVIVTTNMFGDIATDLAAVLQGGLGLATAANVGDDHAMFEPVHGSAPRHAGLGRANPLAALMSLRHLLDWLGSRHHDPALRGVGNQLETAVTSVLSKGSRHTYDLADKGRVATTEQVTDDVLAWLGKEV